MTQLNYSVSEYTLQWSSESHHATIVQNKPVARLLRNVLDMLVLVTTIHLLGSLMSEQFGRFTWRLSLVKWCGFGPVRENEPFETVLDICM